MLLLMSNTFKLPDYHYSRLHKWSSNMWDKDAGKLLKRYIQQFMINQTSLLVKTNTIDSDYINTINQTDFSNKKITCCEQADGNPPYTNIGEKSKGNC